MSATRTETHSKKASANSQASRRYPVLSLTALIVAAFLSLFYHKATSRPLIFFGHPIRPAKIAYDFRLTDQDGAVIRLSQWKGDVVLFSFGFTHCPNVCPTTLTNLADAFRALPESDRNRVHIAFISVDPRRDAPAQLKNYLSFFDPAFIGLSGPKEEIDRATGAFGATYAFIHKPSDPADDYNVMHSADVYLINPEGAWEIIYDIQQLRESAKVAADIETVLHE
jgi:protein SCO1/2